MAPLSPLCDGVWLATAPVRILGMRLTSTMTVMRLGGRALLVCSPIALDDDLRAAVEALGDVAHLYAPNLYHHMAMGPWIDAFPDARVHAPPGLAKKRPDLRIDRKVDATPAFDGIVDEIRIDGFRLDEIVLFHRPSATLVLTDLVSNVGRPQHGWTKLYTRAMGFYDRVALSRMIRWAAFSDRNAARKSIERILALPFERVVVGHGEPLLERAREQLVAATQWLNLAAQPGG
jgi:hypothetical protein